MLTERCLLRPTESIDFDAVRGKTVDDAGAGADADADTDTDDDGDWDAKASEECDGTIDGRGMVLNFPKDGEEEVRDGDEDN